MKKFSPFEKRLFILGFLFLLLLFIIGIYIWWQKELSPPSASKNKITFVIFRGESIHNISQRLSEKKIIRNPLAFKIYLKIKNLDQKIQAGSFLLPLNMSAKDVALSLTKGTFDVWVTLPEGLRKEEIAQILNKNLGIEENEFVRLAKEGYLFPDTYLIPKNYTVQNIIDLLMKNWQKKTSSLNHQFTYEEVILASIVEREALHDEDRPLIAGILIKRKENGWALEADATVQYALGFDETNKTWWRKNLTKEDLNFDSPYNTRKYANLPPTPICNPGLKSLQAVISPQKSPFWFYLSDPSGKTHYAVSLEEHNQNIKKYLLTK